MSSNTKIIIAIIIGAAIGAGILGLFLIVPKLPKILFLIKVSIQPTVPDH